MPKDEAEQLLLEFFADKKNSSGDYWGKDTARAAVEVLIGRPLNKEPK